MTEVQKRLVDKQTRIKNFIKKEKKTYSQNWAIYYASCKSEKLMVFKIIKDAVDYLEIPNYYTGIGRLRANVPDIVKSLCIKSYCGVSSWRIESELKIAKSLGIIDNVYKRTSLNFYQSDKEITKWLHKLYKTIAEPLAFTEDYLIIDATGISVSYGKKRWIEVLTEHRLHTDYKKLHALCGSKSNVFFAVQVSEGKSHESPFLKQLVDEATKYVDAKMLCADSGYLSKFNADYISSKGLIPLIMPKKNSITRNRGSSGAWGAMIRLWKENNSIFRIHFHQRSNIESSFSALKRKFGFFTRAKNPIGQTNEILTKVVCFNACILAEGVLEFNIEPVFTVN